MKKLYFHLSALIVFTTFLQSCGNNIPLPTTDYFSTTISFTPNIESDCYTFMMFKENIEKIEVTIYTINTQGEQTLWDTAPIQEIDTKDKFEYKIKVPNEGYYMVTLKVIGKCADCCSFIKCYPKKGKPVYIGSRNKLRGAFSIHILVKFAKCLCCAD